MATRQTKFPPLKRLRDIVVDRPRVLLVGINPGLRSAQLGHHFAGLGNPFWRLLHAAGITPVALTAEEDHRLAELGIALTNVCARPTRSAAELSPDELDAGFTILLRKCARMQPRVLALVGVSLYTSYVAWAKRSGRSVAAAAGGPGEKPETVGRARVFVVPNPSGLNASYPGFQHKLVWYRALAEFADATHAG